MPVVSVPEAIDVFRNGQFLIIVDDEDRENEGDLAIAAEAVTPEAIAFMARYASGLICVPMAGEDLDRLGLPMMVPAERNGTRFGTAFTVSIEAREGVTTGISAHDRARTIQVLADPESSPGDLAQPGHIFPLRAQSGGVLTRPGQTEASVDLARLAGLRPAAVICEIMDDDGRMARMPSLEHFSQRHGIPIVTIADLVAWLRGQPANQLPERDDSRPTVQHVATTRLPTATGRFDIHAYQDLARPGSEPHLALVTGDLSGPEPVLVRLHSECVTGDIFGSERCDCGEQLARSMEMIAAEGRGVLLYLRQEGRGIGFVNKLRAYALQDQGFDTVEANHRLGFPADLRDYRIAVDMLHDLGVARVTVLTNNPDKLSGLTRHGIDVVERIPLIVNPGVDNLSYMRTKQHRLGHLLDLDARALGS